MFQDSTRFKVDDEGGSNISKLKRGQLNSMERRTGLALEHFRRISLEKHRSLSSWRSNSMRSARSLSNIFRIDYVINYHLKVEALCWSKQRAWPGSNIPSPTRRTPANQRIEWSAKDRSGPLDANRANSDVFICFFLRHRWGWLQTFVSQRSPGTDTLYRSTDRQSQAVDYCGNPRLCRRLHWRFNPSRSLPPSSMNIDSRRSL